MTLTLNLALALPLYTTISQLYHFFQIVLLIEYCPKLIYDIFIEFLMIKKQIWHLERYLVTLLLASILGERISSDGKILTIIF